MPLSAVLQSRLTSADPLAVIAGATRIEQQLSGHRRWVGQRNRYRKDCATAIETHRPPYDAQLQDYLAASVPLHCLDGWAYLSRALDSQIQGDSHSALHLAYYAELRAGMSILATQAIGVLNRKHFIIDGSGTGQTFRGPGTHSFVWLALEHWSAMPSAAALVGKVVQSAGSSLDEWLSAVGFSNAGPILATRWLRAWGLDLARLSEDRDLRNAASYRPTSILTRHRVTPEHAKDVLLSLWRSLEPQGATRFGSIDKYLVRLALEAGYRGQTGKNPRAARNKRSFSSHLAAGMNTLGLSEPVAGEWKNFFLRAEQSGDPWLIERANERDDADILVQYPQVIARAILLLRIATGAARLVATDAAWSNSAMEFWWNEIGLDACLWDDDARPAAVVDLWADVQQAIEDLEGWSRKSARPEMVKRTWISDNAAALMTLGGIERVGLWGLGL